MNKDLIAQVVLVIGCLNILLSAIQQIFAKLSQAEPDWLQKVSTVILKVVQYVGSNTPTPPSTPPVNPPAVPPEAPKA